MGACAALFSMARLAAARLDEARVNGEGKQGDETIKQVNLCVVSVEIDLTLMHFWGRDWITETKLLMTLRLRKTEISLKSGASSSRKS